MRIKSLRFGFATSSSSVHSIVFFGDKKAPKGRNYTDGDYGWEDFLLTIPDEKTRYLATMAYTGIREIVNHDAAVAIVNSWFGTGFEYDDDDGIGHIDHQSHFALPRTFDGKMLDKRFLDDLNSYLRQDKIGILGGNDNQESFLRMEIGSKYTVGELPWEYDPYGPSPSSWVSKYDEEHGFWTLFNRKTGDKVRLLFGPAAPGNLKIKTELASTPELVDIKITDCCQHGCPYCYQKSTPSGKHADENYLRSLAWALEDLQVFEAAIGGGDPLEHPYFLSILRLFRDHNIIPNWSTRGVSWLRSLDAKEMIDLSGSVAVSVERAQEVKQYGAALEYLLGSSYYYYHPFRGTLHVVEGVPPKYELLRILRAAKDYDLPVVILGFKNEGRAKSGGYDPRDYNVVEVLQEAKEREDLGSVGVDTALVEKYREELKEMGIDDRLMVDREGTFSFYVDAVDKEIGVSSYGTKLDELYHPSSDNIQDWWDRQQILTRCRPDTRRPS